MNSKFVFSLFSFLLIPVLWFQSVAAAPYPMANVKYVSDMAARYGCALVNNANPKTAVNMEYLLKTVDICNAGGTSYGDGQYATKQAANTYAVDYCIANLVDMGPRPQFTFQYNKPARIIHNGIFYYQTERYFYN